MRRLPRQNRGFSNARLAKQNNKRQRAQTAYAFDPAVVIFFAVDYLNAAIDVG